MRISLKLFSIIPLLALCALALPHPYYGRKHYPAYERRSAEHPSATPGKSSSENGSGDFSGGLSDLPAAAEAIMSQGGSQWGQGPAIINDWLAFGQILSSGVHDPALIDPVWTKPAGYAVWTALTIAIVTFLFSFFQCMGRKWDRMLDGGSGFVSNGPASSNYTLTLHLGLAQGDIVGLEERAILISTSSSADYGKFMSKEQVEAYVAPKQETTTAVQDFLAQNNLTAEIVTPVGDMLSIDLTAEKATTLFDAQFQTFVHAATQQRAVRTLHYWIPMSLRRHLEFVHLTTVFPELLASDTFIASFTPGLPSGTAHGTATSSSVPSSCSSVVTLACLQALYGIPMTPATQTSN
ncbi:Pro-kumamolisin, activation domain-containing protein [Vararia minispora EC-137]|uniref:Pro-kumamolisin, activation domain-containing protein n=1 Tax=Vararia minispora EC-137 TaxID=1314806 RepID=A0ACB8Q5Y8_9AGAM|nr:Pro-kumamolisin, activation domain-containing protein [Vararia minispora EC-137]